MLDAKKVVDYALSQVGTAEDPLGSNKQIYGAMIDQTDWYLYKEGDRTWRHLVNGYDWCSVFTDSCFITCSSIDEARKVLNRPVYNNYGAVVKYSFNYLKSAGRAWPKSEHTPVAGDIIYFQNAAGLCHVGIVTSVSGNTVNTVEGNSGKNSWYVAKHTYDKSSSYIYGYGQPKYDAPDPDPKELDGYKVGNTYEVVCNDDLMIRKGPGQSYDTVGSLKKGDKIKCTKLAHDASLNTWLQFDKGWSCGIYQGAKYLDDPDPVSTGWVQKDGKWYYYNSKGEMVKSSWILYKGDYYYVGKDGVMYTGWREVDKFKYYFYPDGPRAYGEWIDGLALDMSGKQMYGKKGSWVSTSGGKRFKTESGWYPRNRSMKIDGKEYKFDSKGYKK